MDVDYGELPSSRVFKTQTFLSTANKKHEKQNSNSNSFISATSLFLYIQFNNSYTILKYCCFFIILMRSQKQNPSSTLY